MSSRSYSNEMQLNMLKVMDTFILQYSHNWSHTIYLYKSIQIETNLYV